METGVSGKVALITGAGSGMGREMARTFAEEGARIVAVDLDSERVGQTTRMITEQGGEALDIVADVSQATDVSRMVEQALERFGSVDILCNNAGISDDYKTACEMSEELWDRVLGVNVKSAFLTSKHLIPGMLENGGGKIVNTASISGLVAGAGGAAYTASKHAVVGLTKQLAFDYGPKGIRVNAICPGSVETDMTRERLYKSPAPGRELINSAVAGRHAQPEEVAKLALYLASDNADFVHGAAMVIDGGRVIK